MVLVGRLGRSMVKEQQLFNNLTFDKQLQFNMLRTSSNDDALFSTFVVAASLVRELFVAGDLLMPHMKHKQQRAGQ